MKSEKNITAKMADCIWDAIWNAIDNEETEGHRILHELLEDDEISSDRAFEISEMLLDEELSVEPRMISVITSDSIWKRNFGFFEIDNPERGKRVIVVNTENGKETLAVVEHEFGQTKRLVINSEFSEKFFSIWIETLADQNGVDVEIEEVNENV